MNFLIFQFKRLLGLPFALISSPGEMVNTLWTDSGRGRAMLLGIPALIFAVIGISTLLWAKFGLAGSLEQRYKAKLEQSNDEKIQLIETLKQEIRMLQASQQTSGKTSQGSLIAQDDPRRLELETWRSREQIYLEKLIDLNPGEPQYLFQLALVFREKGDINRCLALMNLTAPLDEPGYINGHLWLANYYMNTKVETQREAFQNVDLAMAHAEQCLKREKDNETAKQIKATLLFVRNRDLKGAYEIFYELFQEKPHYFRSLVEINKRMGTPGKSKRVLELAVERFSEMIRNDALEADERMKIWDYLTTCYAELKEFPTAEKKLLEEIELQSKTGDGSGRVWSEQMLGSIYVRWIGELDLKAPGSTEKHLEFLKKAYRLDPSNQNVMRQLTRLGFDQDPTISQAARRLYDGSSDPNAPASVLNEIGMQALSRSEYKSALDFFQSAFKKADENPEILNNLAYTYTVGERPNPQRALTLIDRAFKFLPQNDESKIYITHFRDTRGQALMQLNRWTDAIAEFEYALRDRPDNLQILESLVKCCQASGLDETPWLRRIEEVKQLGKSPGESSNDSPSN